VSRLGIVTGLIAEADCIARRVGEWGQADRPFLYCAGANGERAREGALRLIEDGAEALVSFGIAGGLEPGLEPGALICADTVQAPDKETIATSQAWRQGLIALIGDAVPVSVGAITTTAVPVTSAAAKEALARDTGAIAVDMESHGVGAAAAEAGVPFIVVRAVADPARRALPWAVLAGIDRDGRPRPLAVSLRLLLRPLDIADVVRLAGDNRAALASLRRVASVALPQFGLGA
jgi:adenosylhomocysteine nucleosidase